MHNCMVYYADTSKQPRQTALHPVFQTSYMAFAAYSMSSLTGIAL